MNFCVDLVASTIKSALVTAGVVINPALAVLAFMQPVTHSFCPLFWSSRQVRGIACDLCYFGHKSAVCPL